MTDESPVTKGQARPGVKSWDKAGYTIPGFARLTGLAESTVRRAVSRKEIKTVSFGGLVRIPPSEAERIMQEFELKDHTDQPFPRAQTGEPISHAEHLAAIQPAIVAQMETLLTNATGLRAADRKSMLVLIDILKTTLGTT